MTDWTAFVGFTGVVLALFLFLAHISQESLSARPDPSVTPDSESGSEMRRLPDPGAHTSDGSAGLRHVPTRALLVNVAITQGLFACFLLLGVWVTEVPAAALGVGRTAVTHSLLVGVAFGAGLYVANEVGSAVGERVGIGGEERLREALAPETGFGWVLLLVVVLPVIAGFEELLFRGVLVGALAAGFGLSPWILAGLSSVAFAVGHGAQGTGGVVVSGVLGFALAAAFVLTGSLLVVVVAHYLVNALAFVVHEGLGWDPFE